MDKDEKITELIYAASKVLRIWDSLPGCIDPKCALCQEQHTLKTRLKKAVLDLSKEVSA